MRCVLGYPKPPPQLTHPTSWTYPRLTPTRLAEGLLAQWPRKVSLRPQADAAEEVRQLRARQLDPSAALNWSHRFLLEYQLLRLDFPDQKHLVGLFFWFLQNARRLWLLARLLSLPAPPPPSAPADRASTCPEPQVHPPVAQLWPESAKNSALRRLAGLSDQDEHVVVTLLAAVLRAMELDLPAAVQSAYRGNTPYIVLARIHIRHWQRYEEQCSPHLVQLSSLLHAELDLSNALRHAGFRVRAERYQRVLVVSGKLLHKVQRWLCTQRSCQP